MPFPYICSGNNFPFSESGLPPYTTDATKPESKKHDAKVRKREDITKQNAEYFTTN